MFCVIYHIYTLYNQALIIIGSDFAVMNCFALSPRRPYEEYKRMVLEHTHGLFIT
jgi:hypothetical protein